MQRRQRTEAPGDCQEFSHWSRVDTELFCFTDSCNVYVLRAGDRAVVIDAGTGAWGHHLDELGIHHIDAIVLTHIDRDQCCALYRDGVPTIIASAHLVAPAGDAHMLQPEPQADFWRAYQSKGCPASYGAPTRPRPADAVLNGDSEVRVGAVRLCAVATPGHGRGALSYVVDWHGKQLVFCGDAATGTGTVHHPFQLEWDHWTPEGALAAWYGLERLGSNRIDWLLPAHGRPVRGGRRALQATQRRLLNLVRAKTAVAPGARSRWADSDTMDCGARRLSEHLYSVGGNGFVLADDNGSALVIDPTKGDMKALQAFVDETNLHPDVATASHYHIDHTDALNDVRQQWGASIWLHPRVAAPITDRDRLDVPWLPPESVQTDRILPEQGTFRWQQYRFGIRPFAGQTWWHCAFDTQVDGQHVLFSGDNFQPPTRWNGTGGFCAYNGSRFTGFADSARIVMELEPDLICNGHRCIYHYDADQYRRILKWCDSAEATVKALCPAGEDWLADYDPRVCRWEPFVQTVNHGGSLQADFVYTNHHSQTVKITVVPVPRADILWKPTRRTMSIPAGASRRAAFDITVRAAAGRHILAADVHEAEHLRAEAAVTLINIV